MSYPTQTAPWDPKIKNYAYCYSANSGGDLRLFSDRDYTRVTESFCRNNFVLDPGHGPISWNGGGNGYDVIISADWAKDQTGCSAQKPYEFAKNLAAYERCRNSWLGGFYCNGEDTYAGSSSFGGAYVFDDFNGCIVFDIHTRPKLGTSGQNKRGLGYGLMSNVSFPAVLSNSSGLADVWPEFDGVSSTITGRWTLTNVFAMDPNK